MKILRYGISDDVHGDIPRGQRSWYLAQERLAIETGQPWETVLKRSWPSSGWADDVERDIERERPDLIALFCAAFWVSYPSSPLKLHRSRFPGSAQIARFGFWAASKPLLADRGLFHLGRRIITGESTAAFFVEPETAIARTEKVIRTVLRHEDIALAVRGPFPLNIAGSAAFRALCETRRAALDTGLAELCRTLHVEYAGFAASDTHPPDELLGDRVHVNAKGHAKRAEHEFDVMSRAWRAHTRGLGD